MMDQIIIKDLEVYANHGLYKEEKVLGQKFLVSAVLYVDTKLAGVSDQMEFSVDYGKVCHVIKDILTENDFNLIECVAETVAKKLLLKFPLVRKLEIEVKNHGHQLDCLLIMFLLRLNVAGIEPILVLGPIWETVWNISIKRSMRSRHRMIRKLFMFQA